MVGSAAVPPVLGIRLFDSARSIIHARVRHSFCFVSSIIGRLEILAGSVAVSRLLLCCCRCLLYCWLLLMLAPLLLLLFQLPVGSRAAFVWHFVAVGGGREGGLVVLGFALLLGIYLAVLCYASLIIFWHSSTVLLLYIYTLCIYTIYFNTTE